MKRTIRLTESELNNIVKRSVKRVLNEANSSYLDENNIDVNELEDIAKKFQNRSKILLCFVKEYNQFYNKLSDAAHKLGLVVTSLDENSYYYFLEGKHDDFNITFWLKLPNVDITTLDDEEYDDYVSKIKVLHKKLVEELNDNYKSFDYEVIDNEESITITIEFYYYNAAENLQIENF